MMTSVPRHKGAPFIGNSLSFLKDVLYFPQQLHRQYGPVFCMEIPSYDPIFVFSPTGIRHVFEKNHLNYHKSSDYDALALALGKGLLTNEGESWKRMRKELQPYFFENVITNFIDLMFRHSENLVASFSDQSDPFAINPVMKRTTLGIASEAFFGVELNSFEVDVPKIVDTMNDLVTRKMRIPLRWIPFSVPIPHHLKMKHNLKLIDGELQRLSKTVDGETYNLLSLLLNNPRLSTQEIRDEIITFLVAGYETTANAMMFTLALLANHPEIQQDVIDEVRATPLEPTSYKEWKTQFPLLHAVIQESMRLYPPGWIMGRRAIEDDVIDGFDIPKNSTILIDAFLVHRMTEYWEDPEVFKPSRFFDPPEEKFSYIPFGGGPRVCIGQHFAMLEMVTLMHHLFSEYRLQSVDTTISLTPLVTLTPTDPLVVKLVR